MKYILALVLSLNVSVTFAQSTPFRDYLRSKYPSCYAQDSFGEWQFIPGCTAITEEDSLDFQNIFSLGGQPVEVVDLQYFTSVKYMNGSSNALYNILAFPPALEKLILENVYYDGPAIGPEYAALPPTLTYLDCNHSWKLSLPALPASLVYLNCSYNKLAALPALPDALDTLICNNQNNYEQNGTILSTLPSLQASLKFLDCKSNMLSSLPDLPASLKYLDCSDQYARVNPETTEKTLTSLPALPAALEFLNCSTNKLSELPFLPISLIYLYCAGTRYDDIYTGTNEGISALPRLPENLLILDCSQSNLDCLPHLPASLISITLDRNRILCLPNAGTYTVLPAGPFIPICSVTNNPSQCTSAALISGDVYFDYNSNGIKDPQENYCSNVPVVLSTGLQTFTNNAGHFQLYITVGNYSVSATAPQYFNVNPASVAYSFSTYDTTVYVLIALQPNTAIDSAYINIIPSVARPGFLHQLLVKFENVGTTIVDADVTVSFDATKLNFISVSNPSVIQTGNQLTLHITDWFPRTPLQFSAQFMVPATVPINDTIISFASIAAGSNTSYDSSISIVMGSYDPNDKTATAALSSAEVNSGKFINYLVRFQNTGTDTAFNVVITDTLDVKLNASSFEMISASHNVKATRDAKNISFEFLNIQLPDSNVNEPLSHGYIRYRLKPQQSVIPGDVIPNSASIYFDFNSPVITNIANTSITTDITIPLKLLSFQAFKGVDDNILFIWKTENEINVDRYELQRSINAVSFSFIQELAAQKRSSNTYSSSSNMTNDIEYFRLKMFDTDGRYSYSNILPVKRSKHGDKLIVLNNPAHNQLDIIAKDATGNTAYLINASGQTILSTMIKGGLQSIDISTVIPGIYYLRCGTEVKKIFIK